MSFRLFTLLLFWLPPALLASLPTTHGALLNHQRVVPPAAIPANGVALLAFHPIQSRLKITLLHDVVDPLGVFLSGPAEPDGNGPVIADLGGAESPVTTEVSLSEQEAEDLFAGRLYFLVTSATQPEGALRGNIQAFQILTTKLSGAQVVPPTPASSMGSAVMTYDFAKSRLHLLLWNPLLATSSISLNGPATVGSPGEVLFDWGPFFLLLANVDLTAEEEGWLLDGLLYLQIQSSTYPEGHLRGQIDPLLMFSSLLTGLAAVPPVLTTATGGVLFTYRRVSRSLTYLVIHNEDQVTRAAIHGPAEPGVNGPLLFDLGSGQSPISGQVNLSADQEQLLFDGQLYLTLSNDDFPNGVLRGQVTTLAETAGMVAHFFNLVSGWGLESECSENPLSILELINYVDEGITCVVP